MSRRARTAWRFPGDTSDPFGFPAMVAAFAEWMRTHGYSERTVENRQRTLAYLADWLCERGVTRPAEVTRPMLERYQRHLYHYRKADGDPLSFRSQSQRLLPVRAFFKWAARQHLVLYWSCHPRRMLPGFSESAGNLRSGRSFRSRFGGDGVRGYRGW